MYKSKMLFEKKLRFSLSILFCLGFFGCYVTYTGNAPTPKQSKKAIEQSFLVKSTSIFYPNGMPKNPDELPLLPQSSIDFIQNQLNNYAAFVRKLIVSDRDVQGYCFGRKIDTSKVLKIIVSDYDSAYAATDSVGYFVIDVKVLQAMYRSAIIESLGRHNIDAGSVLMDYQPDVDDTSELQTFQRYFAILNDIHKLRPSGHLGSVLHPDNWDDSMDFLFLSQYIGSKYFNTIVFVIAHEYGHLILGHLKYRDQIKSNCALFRKLELEADVHAALIQQESGPNFLVTAPWFGNMTLDLLYNEPFLKFAYNISGFIDKPGNCDYPSLEERKRNIAAFADSVIGENPTSGVPKMIRNIQ